MSAGYACRDRAHRDRWVVVARRCNYSSFNGSRRTPSNYSQIRCLACGTYWRTKASYVSRLRDASGDERYRHIELARRFL